MFEECKKYFNDNEFICSFISKAESAYHNKDYPTAITAINNACRVFLERSADYKSMEYTSLNECYDKIKAEFAQEKQRIVQETGCKTACRIDTSTPWQERNKIREKENGYTWDDVKDRNIKTIGMYWQAGIGAGTVDTHMIWYLYFGESARNDTFFIVAEISEQEYLDLCDKYKEFLYDDAADIPSHRIPDSIVKEIKEYILNSKIIMEGWYLL